MMTSYFGNAAILMVILLTTLTTTAAPGDLDTTFGVGGKARRGTSGGMDEGQAVAIADGRIVVAGTVSDGGLGAVLVARYNLDGSPDLTFGDRGRVATTIWLLDAVVAIRAQTDAKIVVAANTGVDITLLRYNIDGSLDTTFDGDGKVFTDISSSSDDRTTSMTIQPNGKIVVAGSSSAPGGRPHFALLRYNTDGSPDTTFSGDGKLVTTIADLNEEARGVTVQDDGKILIAGFSMRTAGSGSATDCAVLRYLSTGVPDATWDGDGAVITTFGGPCSLVSVVFQKGNGTQSNPDKVVVAGDASSATTPGWGVLRFTIGGAPDPNFSQDGRELYSIAGAGALRTMSTEGTTAAPHKIILMGGDTNFNVVRLTSTGAYDGTLDADGMVTLNIGTPRAMTFLGTKLVLTGRTIQSGIADTDLVTALLNTNGTIDTTFDGDGVRIDDYGRKGGEGLSMAMQPDGKILGLVYVFPTGGSVIRFNQNGSPDLAFGTDGFVSVPEAKASAIASQPDGRIVIAGTSQSTGHLLVARLNNDGTLDTTFADDGTATIPTFVATAYAVAVQADGKIVVAGQTGSNAMVARFNPNGAPDASFDGDGIVVTPFGSNSAIVSLAIQSDGKIVGAGYTNPNSNFNKFAVFRYETNGTLDTSFSGDGVVTATFGNFTDEASGVAIQPDGKIVVAGKTIDASNSADVAVIRFNPSGFPDTSFDLDGKVTTAVGSLDDIGRAVAIQPNGKIFIVGSSETSRSLEDYLIIRYNSDGSLDNSFWNSDSLYGNGGKVTVDFERGHDEAGGIVIDSSGRAVVGGNSDGLVGIVRLSGDGAAGARAPFDYDADGKTDISIFRPSVGQWWGQRSSNGAVFATTFGVSTDQIVPADYTGDGKTDIAFFRPSTGTWFILRSEDFSFYSIPFGTAGDIPDPGTYDTDNKADIAVFRPSTSTWFINKSAGGVDIIGFGAPTDKPVVADYDGDGKTDIAIYRPAVGEWWIRRSLNQTVFALSFGNSADRPVPGDFTGDGKADIAFWRPSTGNWYILRSEDFSFFSFPFGASGDIPAPGDYDGDGRFDPAVFRPIGSTWFVNRSTAGILIATFGAAGDSPVPAAFIP